jgi:adenylate kinase
MKSQAFLLHLLPVIASLTSSAALGQMTSGPLIVLVGPPLSGKTTQTSILEDKYGIPTLAADDLIKANADELKKTMMVGQSLFDMRYDPALSRFLRNKLDAMDRSKGLALDSFPATNLQAQDLAKVIADYAFKPVVLIQFEIPDDVVRQRAAKAGRAIDRPTELEQRLKEYHRQFDNIGTYFPNAKIHRIDGTKPVAEVSREVDKLVQADGLRPKNPK